MKDMLIRDVPDDVAAALAVLYLVITVPHVSQIGTRPPGFLS
jgi:hypothetical protein